MVAESSLTLQIHFLGQEGRMSPQCWQWSLPYHGHDRVQDQVLDTPRPEDVCHRDCAVAIAVAVAVGVAVAMTTRGWHEEMKLVSYW